MFEPVVGIYRFNEKDGSFCSCCTLIFEEDTVVIKAVNGRIGLSEMKELREFLVSMGIKRARYKRKGVWKEFMRRGH